MKEVYLYEIVINGGVIEVEDGKITGINKFLAPFMGKTLKDVEDAVYQRRHKLKLQKVEKDDV